jgi:hypothetical protein
MKRLGQDLIVTAFGAGTSLITALILFGIERAFDISIYTWTFWFVIPAGALISGFVAATGYWLGARILNHRPSKILLINMIGVSVGTFFLVHYLSYYSMEIEGVPVRSMVPFSTYLNIALTKVSMTFRFHASKLGETGELGGWGYVTAALQILGFAVGGLGAFGYLADSPFCSACSRYFKHGKKIVRYTGDPEALKSFIESITPLMENCRLDEAVAVHSSFGAEKAEKDHHLSADIDPYDCTGCSGRMLRLSIHKRAGSDWKEISGLKQEATTSMPASAPAISP